MNIGDIYWLKQSNNIAHPQVVVNFDGDLITLCSITSNQNKASMPGNVVLDEGEGGLDKSSIVEVSKTIIVTIDELERYVGTLSDARIEEIMKGISFINNLLPNDRVQKS
ncbi:MAG: type II toxin-antitoxin system PemK/MazF family toxin [Candidatus Dojkabacteria bacterium]